MPKAISVNTALTLEKNPPLFPFAAAAVTSGAVGATRDNVVPMHDAVLTENKDPKPGVGCVWCWHVAAAGDGGLGLPRLQDFLPTPLVVAFGLEQDKRDYIDIEGGDSYPCVSSDWSRPSDKGLLCIRAPIFFDSWNATGSKSWNQAAQGCIVVARRGGDAFETTTRNAEKAGAVGVVILDDRERWDDDFEMTLETRGVPPRIPAVLVPKRAEAVLTGTQRSYAVIVRR